MFDKRKDEAATLDDGREDTARGGLKLAVCGPGARAAAVVGNKLNIITQGCVGGPVQGVTLALPPGRVIALNADGPVVLMSNGELHFWQSERWNRVGNINDEVKP